MAERQLIGWEQIAIARRICDYFEPKIIAADAEQRQYHAEDRAEIEMYSLLREMFPNIAISAIRQMGMDFLNELKKFLNILEPTG